jgi:hypothetical protein
LKFSPFALCPLPFALSSPTSIFFKTLAVSTWAKLIVHFETAGSREQGAGRKRYNSVVNIQFILFKYLLDFFVNEFENL